MRTKNSLPAGVSIDLTFEDLEKEASWAKIDKEKSYDRIILHYVCDELKDSEAVIAKASKVLNKDGFFSVNAPGRCDLDDWFKNALKEASVEESFLDENIAHDLEEAKEFDEMIGKYFSKIDTVSLSSSFRFDEAEDLFDYLCNRYKDQAKFLSCNKCKIKEYLAAKIAETGEIIITTSSRFLHCSV